MCDRTEVLPTTSTPNQYSNYHHTMPKVQPPTPRTTMYRKNVQSAQNNISNFFLDGIKEAHAAVLASGPEQEEEEEETVPRFDSGYEEPDTFQPAVYEISRSAYGLAASTIDRRKQAALRRKKAEPGCACKCQTVGGGRRSGACAVFRMLTDTQCSENCPNTCTDYQQFALSATHVSFNSFHFSS